MSRSQTPNYDIFLSHIAEDEGLAEPVKQHFRAAGLSVFRLAEIAPGSDYYEAIRVGIRDSLTFVTIATPASVRSPLLTFEYGAAWALGTPVFVLTNGMQPADLPIFLARHEVASVAGGLARVTDTIRELTRPLTEAEKRVMRDEYALVGVPADRLIGGTDAINRLASSFTNKTDRPIQPSRLIRELLRLRKAGKLPRLKGHAVG